MRILPQEAIVLCIDFQEKLVPSMHDKEEIVGNAVKLLSGIKLLDIPVLITRQYPKGIGDTVEAIKKAAPSGQVHDKNTFSVYHDAGIKKALDGGNRKKVILCGTEAHVCVLQTAIDLLAAGYQVYYVTDCMASRKANDKKFGIKRAAQEGAFLTTYEGILFELMGDSTIPQFRDVSAIIK